VRRQAAETVFTGAMSTAGAAGEMSVNQRRSSATDQKSNQTSSISAVRARSIKNATAREFDKGKR